jgi:hypothetical protein
MQRSRRRRAAAKRRVLMAFGVEAPRIGADGIEVASMVAEGI